MRHSAKGICLLGRAIVAVVIVTVSSVACDTEVAVTATPTISPVDGTYDTIQTVTITCSTPGAEIFYTLDGSDPLGNEDRVFYTGAFDVEDPVTVCAYALASGMAASQVADADLNVVLPVTATPVFDPAPGTYAGEVTVAITCATPNAVIRYTNDGMDPGLSSTVFSPTLGAYVSASRTVKAIAYAENHKPSEIAVGEYTITAGR